MNNRTISRTGERVLGIIGIIFNVLTILLLVWLITSFNNLEGTAEFDQFQEEFMNDPAFEGSPEDAQMVLDMLMDGTGVVGWTVVALLAISTILAILAIVNLKGNRNSKLAGVFFILAGLLAGVLSLTSILFYIAAIMCFVRKPPMGENHLYRNDDTVYREDKVNGDDDTVYRETPRRTEKRREDDSPYRPL